MNIDWQTIVALLALAFSVYTFRKAQNLAEKQAELVKGQKRLNDLWVAKEESEVRNAKRADVSANLVRLPKGAQVKVFNKGKAEARNVRIEFNEDESIFIRSDVDSKFPLERLEPQQGVDLIAAVHMSSPSKIPLKLLWDDDHGTNHAKTVYLTH